MNTQRKKIIISEIKYWKQSKLLPGHYCDFLIALYSQGEEMDNEEVKTSSSILSREKRRLTRKITVLLLFAAVYMGSLFIFVNYSTGILALSAVVLLFLLMYARTSAAIKSGIIPFIYIISAFMLLAMSLKLWIVYFEGQMLVLFGLLIVNCVLWLIVGKRQNLVYFLISGAVGILLVIGFLIAQF